MKKMKKAVALMAAIFCLAASVPLPADAAEILLSEQYGTVIVLDDFTLGYDNTAPAYQALINSWENDPYWDLCGVPLDSLILLKQASYMGIRFDQNTWTFQANTTPADFAADINHYNAMKGALALDPTLSADYQAQQAALLAQQQAEAAALQAQQEAEAAQAAAMRNQGIAVMQALEPQIQWAGAIAPLGSYTTGSVYGPKLTKQELAEVEAAVQTFVGSYITPEMTDYQKICAINSFLSTTCTYAPDWSKNRANTAWGALIYHQAQCSGYSRATKALCDAVGIPCYYVHGDNTSHQWNKVLIGGNWYVVDITNSVTCQNQLFLTSDAKLAQIAGDTSINSGTPACTLIYPR